MFCKIVEQMFYKVAGLGHRNYDLCECIYKYMYVCDIELCINCSIYEYYGIKYMKYFVNKGVDLNKRTWASNVVIGSFWLVTVVLYGVYTGNLTASLAVPKAKMPFNTLAELAADREYDLIIQTGTITDQLFRVGYKYMKMFAIPYNITNEC